MISSYTVGLHEINHDRLALALSDMNKFTPTNNEIKWYELLRKLPENLLSALHLEVNSGNSVTSIQFGNWPQSGSIVVSLSQPFKNDFKKKSCGVTYRILNDPHYWQADIHQIVDGVEHLIIT
jgi:hypothetical protein